MKIEAEGIIALCENTNTEVYAGIYFTSGILHNKPVVVAVCGVGKVNASMCALAMIEKYKPKAVINSGVAGAVSPLLRVGDIVVAEKSVEHDMNTTALGDIQGEISFPSGKVMYFDCDPEIVQLLTSVCRNIPETKVLNGVVASGDLFVSSVEQRLKINERFNALACEMEGAAIGHTCCCCNVPYGIIRAISDDLTENEGMDFVKFTELASEKSIRAIDSFVEKY